MKTMGNAMFQRPGDCGVLVCHSHTIPCSQPAGKGKGRSAVRQLPSVVASEVVSFKLLLVLASTGPPWLAGDQERSRTD